MYFILIIDTNDHHYFQKMIKNNIGSVKKKMHET
jgi:hypothetical protein